MVRALQSQRLKFRVEEIGKVSVDMDQSVERQPGSSKTNEVSTKSRSGERVKNLRSISPALLRPVMIVGGVAGVALILALLMLVVTSWRSLVLVGPVRAHLTHLSELHQTAQDTQELLIRHLFEKPPTVDEIEAVRDRLARLIVNDHNLDPTTPERLANARSALASFKTNPRAALIASLAEIRKIVDGETQAQAGLIQTMHAYAEWENRIAIGALIVLPLLTAGMFFILRGRILYSLDRISELLERLGGREFVPQPVTEHDKDLIPVLSSYNELVKRLAEAEAENARRRDELEEQVRQATRTVLLQGRELADADRLAAVGETSARIAHELRNPLAGLELGLRNLRKDCEDTSEPLDPSLPERLDPMISEMQRMARLLTSLLDQGRGVPEKANEVDVFACAKETAALARYQTPEGITILAEGEPGFSCLLPRDTLKQVIFNLILNAVQAIGTGPGEVEVKVERSEGSIELAVQDNGPGFPAEIIELGPRMFQSRRPGGTGIGLATVKRLTEQMGGKLTISNRPEGGAIVKLSLPCRSCDA